MIFDADHPASIYCIGSRGVIVNGRPNRTVLAMEIDGNRIEELVRDPSRPGEFKVDFTRTPHLLRRWRSVSSAVPDWLPGHGPGSDCEHCGPFFEL